MDRSPALLWVILVVAVAVFLLLRYENAPFRDGANPNTDNASIESVVPNRSDQAMSGSEGDEYSAANAKSGDSSQNPDPSTTDKSKFKIIGLAPASDDESSSQTDTDGTAVDIPLGDQTISGRVLTSAGQPVVGAKVTVTANYIFEDGKRKFVPRGARKRVTTTTGDGQYSFDRLANGEYNVSVVATERYGKAWIRVRAGVDVADLVVQTHETFRVQGIVTTSDGEPLFGVKVRPQLADANEATTDREGRYRLSVLFPDNRTSLSVRATRDGYKDRDVSLTRDEANASSVRELDIVMEPESSAKQVTVQGTVKGTDGKEIGSQRLTLSSEALRQSFRATTDANGRYAIGGVEPGEDYAVSLNAPDRYRDHFQRNIVVPDKGLTLDIELENLEIGTLRGHMVNVFGNAVADYSLILQTVESSYYNQQVIGDRAGRFEVKKAPAGELRLKTKSNPYYSIEGIELAPGEERDVRIVLDWGYDEILGRIVDQNNSPVTAPNVTLTWTHLESGIRTTARRSTAADERGNFRFTQLGPGSHRLSVNAPGYRPVSLVHDPSQQGSSLRVELVEQ